MRETSDNNKFVTVFTTFGDICLLNVLFILTSLPIVTIGASITSLYSVMLKMVRHEDVSTVKGYFKSFKSNFKQATLSWLIFLAVGAVIWVEYIFSTSQGGIVSDFYFFLMIAESVGLALLMPFYFPILACYENTIFNNLKNSALLAISNMGSWIKVLVAWVAPITLTLIYPVVFFAVWYFWLILLFALIAFGTSHTIKKVFAIVDEAHEANEKAKAEKKED